MTSITELNALSLFSGCGGDTVGMTRAGYKVVAYNEFNKAAIQSHELNFPDSATVAKQNISISTIDKQLTVLGLQPQEIMLKLDVQGFESEVLKGASHSLSKIPLCYLEVSITPLYEGEISFLPILIELSKFGHEVIDVFRGMKANDGRLLQLDILTKHSEV
jgi:FkbM family methyltransferase